MAKNESKGSMGEGFGEARVMSSFDGSNINKTNASMGYHNMADRANVAKSVQEMQGAKSRVQEMGKPGSGSESTGRDY